MKLLLAFTPFHTPTSPPFGLACLKAALSSARPRVDVKVEDWNLAFFRRWLLEEPPHICESHPDHLLGQVCPNLLVDRGQGKEIWKNLTITPSTQDQADRYMTAAKLLDDIYRSLTDFYGSLLTPFVEGKRGLAAALLEQLFAEELSRIEAEKPDLLGFSILAEQNLTYALAIGRLAKERLQIPIALGGAMMSHLDTSELLKAFPWVDYVFWGEGERSIIEFVDAWQGPLDATLGNDARDCNLKVSGLSHRPREGEACLHAPSLPPDVSTLPFADFSDFPLGDYLTAESVLPIITCRGCYWGKCTFCSHTRTYAPGVRTRPANRVVDEMEYQMRQHDVRHFLFVDEAIAPETLRELTCEIRDRKLDVLWGAEGIRVERQFDMELLTHAHKAGLRWVYVGIESATQRLLDLIEKGTDLATIQNFIQVCYRVGIVPQLSFIVGIPGTTHEELEQEIEFLRQYPVDSSSFVLLLDSPMQQDPDNFGIRIEDREALYHTEHGPVHAPRFYFTVEKGLSPPIADRIVESRSPEMGKRMRPHLGEVHALLLADSDFFMHEQRSPTPQPVPERVLAFLKKEKNKNALWSLHVAGSLEAMGDIKSAHSVVRNALKVNGLPAGYLNKLILHLAALHNFSERPDLALSLLLEADPDSRLRAAVSGESARAYYTLGKMAKCVKESEAAAASGYAPPWLFPILGFCYDALGEPEKALAAFSAGETRNWYEPELNRVQARCFMVLKKHRKARLQHAKAERKALFLGHDR